ncbi:2-oxo acid dehydrogenase subunit E2 [Virgibacillus sp. NKC19-16]|uniref:dihydrolipoamide acetyltransferase family protein n=1 Tax=Virgibacillus salidurans TaxID=2831673 RepID=UPI001F313B5C|nr:dihydrolipoamide acetyltransferase family protein [Virgibacillus sp. NKC19-16]UJL45533.1 2-oxo acid dehydrogenase subunit E2 [Virgibacillus sp. NKC19-16]
MIKEFKLPDIGEGLQEAEVVNWFVRNGDSINENDAIAEIQTDKAVVEITSPYGGVVHQLGGEEGESVKVGKTLISVETAIENKENEESKESIVNKEVSQPSASKPRVKAAPSVRKLARELGVPIHEVTPTGRGGKVIASDIRSFTTTVEEEKSKDPEPPKGLQSEPIKGLRKKIFENMTLSMSEIPQCSGMDEVDVSRLSEFRLSLKSETQSGSLTHLPFIVKAVALAIKQNPRFNGKVDAENMLFRYQENIHIGIATATEDGLLVPVVKDADKMTVEEIAFAIEDLSARARSKKLKPYELSGSTFTISNTGKEGGFYATPIINPPEVAILGVHAIKQKPVVKNEEIRIGCVMGLSITFDHRVIDGDHCGQFMRALKEYLERPELFAFKG